MSMVVVRPRGRMDLAAIWEFIADDSEIHADMFVDRITGEVKFGSLHTFSSLRLMHIRL